MIGLIGSILAVFALWGLANPFVGLIGLLFVAMVQPGELYPIFANLRVEMVMTLMTTLSFIIHSGTFRWHTITKRLIGFYIGMIVAIPLSFWPGYAISFTLDFGHIVLYHVLIASIVDTAKKLKILIVTFSALVAYHSFTAVYLYSQGIYFKMGGNLNRAVGLTSASDNPNTLGLMIAAALPLTTLGLLKGMSKLVRLLSLALICINVCAIVLTDSRTAFFVLALITGIYVLRRTNIVIGLTLVLLMGLAGWALLPDSSKARYTTDLKSDESYMNRVRAWHAGGRMFLDNPLTGVGPGCFTFANGGKYWEGGKKIWLNAHSLYVQLPAELGLVGVITFGMYLASIFRENSRLKKLLRESSQADAFLRNLPAACSYSILAYLIGGYTAHDLYHGNWFMLGSVMAALSFLTLMFKQPPAEQPETLISEPEAVGAELR